MAKINTVVHHSLLFTFLCYQFSFVFPDTRTIITNGGNITKPGCQSKCGNISVPYPFGIGMVCAYNSQFNTTCDSDSLYWGDGFKVVDISDSQIRVNSVIATIDNSIDIILPSGLFTLSDANAFVLIGCGARGDAYASGQQRLWMMNTCQGRVSDGPCKGLESCNSTPIPASLHNFNAIVGPIWNPYRMNSYVYGVLGEVDQGYLFQESDPTDPDFEERTTENVDMVIDWVIGIESCSLFDRCGQMNTRCVHTDVSFGGHVCLCDDGYQSNPYLDPGCEDINECENSTSPCASLADCNNTPGGFSCSCRNGFIGDGISNGTGCTQIHIPERINVSSPSNSHVVKFSLGTAFGSLVMIIGITWLIFVIRKRRHTKLSQSYFEKNGGMRLMDKLSSKEGTMGSFRIYSAEELKKATNNYAKDHILGVGGSGTVYKGILRDKTSIAVKKSKVMDHSLVDQFINEVIILTQVTHRNVVKLYGCCFEVEVPLLVYEFISNDTLFDRIHKSASLLWLSWESRLKIAAEVAGAIAYLHSAETTPIIHRDIKSSNILLDEFDNAKVSDFGASRLVPIDLTRVSSGYLDPEYMNTRQLTDKSDVYSFGIVIAELMTGRKSISPEKVHEEIDLSSYFVTCVRENRLHEVIDPRISREGRYEQLHAVANLVVRCLKLNGEERPTMKEVSMELVCLRKECDQQQHSIHIDTDLYPVSSYDDIALVYDEIALECTMGSGRYLLDGFTDFVNSSD